MSIVTDERVTDAKIIEAGAKAICGADVGTVDWDAFAESVKKVYRRMAEAALAAMGPLIPDENGWRVRAQLAHEREMVAVAQKEDLAYQVIENAGVIESLRRDNEHLRTRLFLAGAENERAK